MKAHVAVVGAVLLLAATGQSALAMPTDAHGVRHVRHGCGAAAPSHSITTGNPLGRTRGPGAGFGQL
jgi:hypothetical protein